MRPRRFDTRFFAIDARAVTARLDGIAHADAELVELAWVNLDKAESLDMPDVTRQVLAGTARRGSRAG